MCFPEPQFFVVLLRTATMTIIKARKTERNIESGVGGGRVPQKLENMVEPIMGDILN